MGWGAGGSIRLLPCIHLCAIQEEMKQVFSPLPFLFAETKQNSGWNVFMIQHYSPYKNHVNMEEAKR